MTRQDAIALFKTEFWKDLSDRDIATFQLFEDRLCIPMDVFQMALERTLGRPVWTHELGLDREGLKKELIGARPAPTMQEIIDIIPADKRLFVLSDSEDVKKI